jgi:hypothetical protein
MINDPNFVLFVSFVVNTLFAHIFGITPDSQLVYISSAIRKIAAAASRTGW